MALFTKEKKSALSVRTVEFTDEKKTTILPRGGAVPQSLAAAAIFTVRLRIAYAPVTP